MIDTSDPSEQPKATARVSRQRSLQEYYEDCQFDQGVSSFTDYMQS